MAEKAPEQEKSLEMRVAELEDKLQQLHITEEEMKTYTKVAAALGGGASDVALTPHPDSCVITQCVRACTIRACTVVNQCTIRACTIRQCTIINQCIRDCINECGGGWGGGFSGGGGFGDLGG